MKRLLPWIPFIAACCAFLLMAGIWFVLHHVGRAILRPIPVLVEEDSPLPLEAYPPEQVETMRRYVDILREADGILSSAETVEERVAQLDALCPRMKPLAPGLHGMSEYRQNDLQDALGCPTRALPHLQQELYRYIETYGTAPAAGEDRRLMDAIQRLMDSKRHGKYPIDITPEETVQGLVQHVEYVQTQQERNDLSDVERLEALRLAYDHLSTLRLPLDLGPDKGRAHCQKAADLLRATPGAVEKLDAFITFIRPEARAMLLARNTTQQCIVETQQRYYTRLHDTMYTYFPGLCKNAITPPPER